MFYFNESVKNVIGNGSKRSSVLECLFVIRITLSNVEKVGKVIDIDG